MEQDSQSTDFLYDFVYLDRPRVQSWLAQLVAEGVPVSARYGGTITRSKTIEGGAGVPTVVSGKGAATETGADAHERQYSEEWSIPLNLIDMLDGDGFIADGLRESSQGSLVHVSGRVQLTDIAFLQSVWGPGTASMFANTKITHANKAKIDAQKKYFANLGEILKVMPSNPQIYMRTADGEIAWAVLKPEHAIIDTSMLTLTFGANIQGDWHMIAVVDAPPDNHDSTEQPMAPMGGEIARSFPGLLSHIRHSVGRSSDAYAVNPIAIFRAVPRQ